MHLVTRGQAVVSRLAGVIQGGHGRPMIPALAASLGIRAGLEPCRRDGRLVRWIEEILQASVDDPVVGGPPDPGQAGER